jgi:formylglycine-generating enzyme required for sulfatase activity
MRVQEAALSLVISVMAVCACGGELRVESFGHGGQLVFSTLDNGTNYNYRVEWAPAPAGPWSTFGGAGTWLDSISAAQGSSVTSTVPMFYRTVATRGDYMVVDLSSGASASSYPVTYYGALADLPAAANSDVYKTTNLLMRLIPRGIFMMGSPVGELGRDNDETQHQVTLTQDFYMGVFEVTQKQWERVMGTWPSYFNNASYRDSRPVENVSYDAIRGSSAGAGWPANGNVDADSFMGRLRARTGRVFDLPTESQWEYAGRAGTTTALNSGYNLTSEYSDPRMDEVGRYWYNGGSGYTQNGDTTVGTAKVGSYQVNQWGLYDIHGNVREWCLDWYGTYPGSVSDPKGATSGSYRVLRGGSWGYYANYCRVANRPYYFPDGALYLIGFRACLPPGQ